MCLGARAVLIGRPMIYALGYGQEGVEHLIDRKFFVSPSVCVCVYFTRCNGHSRDTANWVPVLTSELQAAMKLVGITDLSQAHGGLLNTQDLEHLVVRELSDCKGAPRAKI